jgi:hypothetical protein
MLCYAALERFMSNYNEDFYAWTVEQVHLCRSGQLDAIDLEHIIEEIESMGKREKRELSSRMTVLLMHLLKWQHQEIYQGKSWRLTIYEQRSELKKLIKDNSSLKPWLDETVAEAYESAKIKAEIETGISHKHYAQQCEWTVMQILDVEFFPQAY